MFWIGMIVGAIITLVAVIGYFVWVCRDANANFDDLVRIGEAGRQACHNRESTLQVWHEDECLFETVFEED